MDTALDAHSLHVAMVRREIHATARDHLPTLRILGADYEQRGNRIGAKLCWEKVNAADPTEVNAAISYAKNLWRDDPLEAVSVLRAAVPEGWRQELSIARELVVYAEWLARIRRGLMPYHVSTMEECGFHLTTEEWLRYKAAAAKAGAMDQWFVRYAEGERLPGAGYPGHVMETVNWDVDAPDMPADGPADAVPAIWLGCDAKYEEAFARPLARSLERFGVDIHLHVIGEHPLGPIHYHAARFQKLNTWMAENDRPVWMLDVDALANTDPATGLFPLLAGHDVAFRARPGRLEPWNQFNASVVGFNNTSGGKRYLWALARYIAAAGALRWGIDQVAMLCCYESLKPRVKLLDSRAVDYDYQPDGAIWCNSGRNKFDQFKPGHFDPDRQAYVEAFRVFSQEQT